MTPAEDLCSTSFNDTKVKVMKGKNRKAHRGIKVSTPGSAGAGSQDGIASYKVGSDFEFGKVKNYMGILKNPSGPLFSAQFGKNTTNNPFATKSNDGGVWNKKGKFGHSTLSCKIRPRTDDEIAANTIKEAINVNSSGVTDSSVYLNEGFVTVRKKNKPIITQARVAPVRSDNYNNGNMYGMRGKGKNNRIRQFVGNQKQYGNSQGFNGTGNFWRNFQGNNASNRQLNNKNVEIKNSRGNSRQSNGVEWQKNPKSNAGTGFVH
nr:RNA-directed DNA polymerase, eukaryota, reverse transcriptase zinc-binding domain protein [Tanacetum cinerariifolium]